MNKAAARSKWPRLQEIELLTQIEEHVPVGRLQWESVTDNLNEIGSQQDPVWPSRDYDALKAKWANLRRALSKAKPTGDPQRTQLNELTLRCADAIESAYAQVEDDPRVVECWYASCLCWSHVCTFLDLCHRLCTQFLTQTVLQGAAGMSTDEMDEMDSDDEAGVDPESRPATAAAGSAAGAVGGKAGGKRALEADFDQELDLSGAEKLSAASGVSRKMKAAQQAAAGGSWRSQNGESAGARGHTRGALLAATDALTCIAERSPAAAGNSSNHDMFAMMLLEMRRSDERTRRDALEREERLAREEQARVTARAEEMRMQMSFVAALFRQSPTTSSTPIDLVTPTSSPAAASAASVAAASVRNGDLFDAASTSTSPAASTQASAASGVRRSPRTKRED